MRGEDLHDAVKDGDAELVAKILQRKETNTEVKGGTQPCLNYSLSVLAFKADHTHQQRPIPLLAKLAKQKLAQI